MPNPFTPTNRIMSLVRTEHIGNGSGHRVDERIQAEHSSEGIGQRYSPRWHGDSELGVFRNEFQPQLLSK